MAELKLCPFCGAEAKLVEVRSYCSTGWRVICTKACVATLPVWIDTPTIDGSGCLDEASRYTSDQAAAIAVERWNRRTS